MFEGLSIPLLWGMLIVAAAIVVVVFFIKWGYVVVPPHEAHVVVSRGKGKKVFWSKASEGEKRC